MSKAAEVSGTCPLSPPAGPLLNPGLKGFKIKVLKTDFFNSAFVLVLGVFVHELVLQEGVKSTDLTLYTMYQELDYKFTCRCKNK